MINTHFWPLRAWHPTEMREDKVRSEQSAKLWFSKNLISIWRRRYRWKNRSILWNRNVPRLAVKKKRCNLKSKKAAKSQGEESGYLEA